MKMSDVFNLPVFYEHDPLSETAKFSGWHGGESICKSLFLAFDDSDADTICNAINNHDRMADEIAELRAKITKKDEVISGLIEVLGVSVDETSDLREGLKLMIEQFKSEHNCEYEYKIIKWNEDLLNK